MIEHDDIMQFDIFLLRPFENIFRKIKYLYKIIIFTNGTKEYYYRIFEIIAPNLEYIKFRLYRKNSITR